MQYTFKDVFSKAIGKQRTLELFVKAGALAGKATVVEAKPQE